MNDYSELDLNTQALIATMELPKTKAKRSASRNGGMHANRKKSRRIRNKIARKSRQQNT